MLMNYFDKVKSYLIELGYDITFEDSGEGIFRISKNSNGINDMILDCEGEILIMEQHIFDLNSDDPAIYKRLLQINREIVHGAFVLTNPQNKILFRDTLQLANLDINELEGSLNSLTLTLIENVDEILSWSTANA